jgi:hypothetical protein
MEVQKVEHSQFLLQSNEKYSQNTDTHHNEKIFQDVFNGIIFTEVPALLSRGSDSMAAATR